MKNIHLVTWPVPNVLAFTTTRHHPLSLDTCCPPFDCFNLGTHVGDNIVQVKKNRELLLELLPKRSTVQWLDQVHGANVVEINAVSNEAIIADAVITRSKQTALAIMTADCLPILLSTKTGEVIAAIHGGWRPLAQNIIKNTIKKMAVSVDDIYAWLGPCISKEAFEIGTEVRALFLDQSQAFDTAFSEAITCKEAGKEADKTADKTSTKYYADLQHIAQLQLQQLGVNNIVSLAHCTHTMKKDYYSYRRDGVTGRMASIICRK